MHLIDTFKHTLQQTEKISTYKIATNSLERNDVINSRKLNNIKTHSFRLCLVKISPTCAQQINIIHLIQKCLWAQVITRKNIHAIDQELKQFRAANRNKLNENSLRQNSNLLKSLLSINNPPSVVSYNRYKSIGPLDHKQIKSHLIFYYGKKNSSSYHFSIEPWAKASKPRPLKLTMKAQELGKRLPTKIG